jgi:hypothetical protein
LNCPCSVSELAAIVKVVAIVEAENLLLLVASEIVPEALVPTVASESLLDRENWSVIDVVEGILNA